jgi:hypothetical protein
MSPNQKYNTASHFENLYKIFSSSRFINNEGISSGFPFFIHSFPIKKQSEIDVNTEFLIKRLQSEGIEILDINLYKISIDLLNRENLLEQIMDQENRLPKQRLLRILSGPLNINNSLMPEITTRLSENNPKIVFLTGVGAAFPFIRSHTILNNIQSLVGNLPVVMFFPGTYNNLSLKLFDRLDNNFYQAQNLNDYKF